MKRLCFALLAGFLLISCEKKDQPSVQIPEQLLINSDIESNSSGLPWMIPFGPKYDFEINCSQEESYSPSNSLKIARTFIDTTNFFYWMQDYSSVMPAGESLTLKLKIKGVDLEGDGLAVFIQCDGAIDHLLQWATTQENQIITGNFDWTEYTLNIPELNADVRHIYVFLVYLPKTTGAAYFDDITLTHK